MRLNDLMATASYPNDQVRINEEIQTSDALVFLYASWSNSQLYLSLLLSTLAQTKFQVPVYLYDVNLKTFNDFSKRFKIRTHGKGEIYMIRSSKIEDKIEAHPADDADKNIFHFLNKYNMQEAMA